MHIKTKRNSRVAKQYAAINKAKVIQTAITAHGFFRVSQPFAWCGMVCDFASDAVLTKNILRVLVLYHYYYNSSIYNKTIHQCIDINRV